MEAESRGNAWLVSDVCGDSGAPECAPAAKAGGSPKLDEFAKLVGYKQLKVEGVALVTQGPEIGGGVEARRRHRPDPSSGWRSGGRRERTKMDPAAKPSVLFVYYTYTRQTRKVAEAMAEVLR